MAYYVTETMIQEHCCTCGMAFGMTADFKNRRRNDHEWFYCPAGHKQYYTGKSEAEKLREELTRERIEREQAEKKAKNQEAYAEGLERQRAAFKGVITRTKNRISKGLCPCCNRTFQNLKGHMATKHPKYTETL